VATVEQLVLSGRLAEGQYVLHAEDESLLTVRHMTSNEWTVVMVALRTNMC
jgi:hypothetical protein